MHSDTLTRTNRNTMAKEAFTQKDYSKCDVCGDPIPIDKLHIMIDNGLTIRNIYCCPRHRYRTVEYNGKEYIQERTDRELDSLAFKLRTKEIEEGWE